MKNVVAMTLPKQGLKRTLSALCAALVVIGGTLHLPLFAQKKGAKPTPPAAAPAVQSAAAPSAVAASTPAALPTPEKYTSVEGITEYRLPNGFAFCSSQTNPNRRLP